MFQSTRGFTEEARAAFQEHEWQYNPLNKNYPFQRGTLPPYNGRMVITAAEHTQPLLFEKLKSLASKHEESRTTKPLVSCRHIS